MAKYGTLNVTPGSKIAIDKLAKKWNWSKVEFVEKMVVYFEKTGINPEDITVLSIKNELTKFRDTIISFIRKQEKDYILPTFGRVDTLLVRFMEYIENEAPSRLELGHQPQSISNNMATISEEKKNQAGKEHTLIAKEIEDLRISNEVLKLELKTTKLYFEKVLENTVEKSTGLSKKPVVELPFAEINELKKYLKRLSCT